MTSARVILNSLTGLLQKCEDSTLHMLECVEAINIPEAWESVDIIKQTLSLMVRLYSRLPYSPVMLPVIPT